MIDGGEPGEYSDSGDEYKGEGNLQERIEGAVEPRAGLLSDDTGPVDSAPEDIIPGSAVPEAAYKEGDEDIEFMS